MNVEEVLDRGFIAHVNVKSRLIRVINGEEEATPESVRRDDLCIIGEWIYGPGKQYESLPEYQSLKQIHRDFHEAAYEALRLNQKGDGNAAHDYVTKGPFEEKSKEIKSALYSLKNAVVS